MTKISTLKTAETINSAQQMKNNWHVVSNSSPKKISCKRIYEAL